MGWVDIDLDLPRSYPAAQSILPSFHLSDREVRFPFQLLQLFSLLRDAERTLPVPPQERQSQGLRARVIPHSRSGMYPVFHPFMGRDVSFEFSGVAREQNVEQIQAENNINNRASAKHVTD